MCFGIAAAVGIPSYLLARSAIGNTAAMFLMMGVALPAFLLAMYEKDGFILFPAFRSWTGVPAGDVRKRRAPL